MTQDVKHYEDCEQFFLSVGMMYTVLALLQFFGMDEMHKSPQRNLPPRDVIRGSEDTQVYLDNVLDKFVSEYLITTNNNNHLEYDEALEDNQDLVREYSLCLLKLYFILESLRESVKLGDGDRLAVLRKVLLKHFKSHSGHNAYAIEMLISILQDEVFLTKRQAHQTRWASNVNFKGGAKKNIEIDLLQENLNRELKKSIKGMGANKTQRSIDRVSRSAGGTAEIINNFDEVIGIKEKRSSHKHKSSEKDESLILSDLFPLKPFASINGRFHDGFKDASSDPLATLDRAAFSDWLNRHKKNITKHGPVETLDDED